MSQHDYVIANGTGAAVRSDLNNALAAIVSNNSGATEPTTTYAYMWWPDTTTNTLKLRNGANNAWITLRQLDGDFTTVSVDNGSNSAPSIYFNASGTDTGIYSSGTDAVDIATAGTRRLGVASDGDITFYGGNVTLNAQGDLRFADSDSSNWVAFQSPATVASNVTWTLPSADGTTGQVLSTNGSGTLSWATPTPTIDKISEGNTEAEVVDTGADGHFKVTTEGSERLRVDPSGRLLVGTSSVISNSYGGTGGLFQVAKNDYNPIGFFSYSNTTGETGFCPYIELNRARGTQASPSAVGNGDDLGLINFYGYDGAAFSRAALIKAVVDGAQNNAGDMPGRLVFATSPDGSATPVERMRITNTGHLYIGKTSDSFSTQGLALYGGQGSIDIVRSGVGLYINRLSSDGDLVQFWQDTVQEGSISVSGTTVSYNGAHLSRWSQLPSGVERTEILRGSVLSNIDEMCEWTDEENEQLNRMKVSDVEGDKNVSGVFQAWDDDDDTYTNDFYCAMTGDFIIRIAADTTVERGDLLMSAGDGTAKPQDDDIIRSKTIAKVTSTNVSCTYDDGSYCVPCVLMAC